MNYLQIFGNDPETTKKLLNIKIATPKLMEEIVAKTGLSTFSTYQRFVYDEHFDPESEETAPGKKYPVATIVETNGKIETFDHHEGKVVPVEQNPFISYNDTALLTKILKKNKRQEVYQEHSNEMVVDWFTKAKSNSFQPEIVKLLYWRDDVPWFYNYDSSYDGAIIGVRNYSNVRYVSGKCCVVGPFMNKSQMNKPLSVKLSKGTPRMSRIGYVLIGMTMSMVYQGKQMKIDDEIILEAVKNCFEDGLSVFSNKKKELKRPSNLTLDEMDDYIDGQLVDTPPFKEFVEQVMVSPLI